MEEASYQAPIIRTIKAPTILALLFPKILHVLKAKVKKNYPETIIIKSSPLVDHDEGINKQETSFSPKISGFSLVYYPSKILVNSSFPPTMAAPNAFTKKCQWYTSFNMKTS